MASQHPSAPSDLSNVDSPKDESFVVLDAKLSTKSEEKTVQELNGPNVHVVNMLGNTPGEYKVNVSIPSMDYASQTHVVKTGAMKSPSKQGD